MWFFLILLSFATSCHTHPPVTSACRTAKKPECHRAHFVPGHHLLGQGFDIVTMEQTRAHLLDLQSFARNNDACTVCQNTYMNNAWQKLPLAMVDWATRSYCSRKISSEVSRSSTTLAEEASSEVKNDWQAGLELHHKGNEGKLLMAGSHSQVAQFGRSKTATDRYTFIKHHLSCVYYRCVIRSKLLLSIGCYASNEGLSQSAGSLLRWPSTRGGLAWGPGGPGGSYIVVRLDKDNSPS